MATPALTWVRVTPRKSPNDVPAARSSASSMAISSADLAMRCPLTGDMIVAASEAAMSVGASSRGIRWSRSTMRAEATNSAE